MKTSFYPTCTHYFKNLKANNSINNNPTLNPFGTHIKTYPESIQVNFQTDILISSWYFIRLKFANIPKNDVFTLKSEL